MKWYPSDASQQCVRVNSAGVPYEEFRCLYPNYGQTYLSFEKSFCPVAVRDWMVAHPNVPIAACVLYAVAIVFGKYYYFADRPPWNWRRTMAAWNLGLSLFSAWGFIRTFPVLIHNLGNYTWQENFCFDPEAHYGSGSTGLWLQLFVLSKFPELLDTFFIVIHKKPLIFLHWYHHISVLLYCWHSYVTKAPVGIIFCVMNYAVHSLMYFYYFLMAVKLKPVWMNALWITVAQISQMIVGVIVTVLGWYLMLVVKPPEPCYLTADNNLAALIMYGSYLFLFLEFFVQRYFKNKKKRATAAQNGTNGVHSKKE